MNQNFLHSKFNRLCFLSIRLLVFLVTISIANSSIAQINAGDTNTPSESPVFKADLVDLNQGITQQVNKHLLDYQIIELDIQSLDRYVKANPHTARFGLQIGTQAIIEFNLEAHDLRTADYRAIRTTDEGEIEQPREPCFTFKGADNQTVRMTILKDQIKGVFQTEGENIFIEPLSRLTADQVPSNYFAVYNIKDIAPTPGSFCGVTEIEELQNQLQLPDTENRMMMECIELEVATDADYEWFEMYGANSNAEILTNLNMVEGIYLSTFNMAFVIVFQNVWETSADPYTESGSPSSDILAEIRAEWNVNNATFMAVDRDLMHMFSAKDHGGLLGSVSGGLPGVCTDPDVSHGFTADRVGAFLTTAHEIGHNFNGVHGDGDLCGGASASIMCQGEKSLYFSAASITTIQSYIDNNGDCLTECGCELIVDCALISDVTVACAADLPAADVNLPIIIDDCGTPEVTSNDVTTMNGTGCPGMELVIERTYTITDGLDNTTTCEQTLTVVSTNGPTITCPPTMVVECISDFTVNANDATGTAECGDLTFSASGISLDAGSIADCNGATYTVTYTATDFCGRIASCDQQIAVVNDPPTIVCPANAVIECEDEIMPAMDDVMVMTSCDVGSTVTFSDPVMIGQANCDLTVYQVTYTATDVCGRQASCTQSLTIENEGPSINIPADMTLACDASTDPGPAGGVATASYGGEPGSWIDSGEGSTGLVATLTADVSGVPAGATITDVNVKVGADHSWVGDLDISLISPDATEVLIYDESCGSDDNIDAVFDDEGAVLVCGDLQGNTDAEQCTGLYNGNGSVSGAVLPANALSTFNGEAVNGTWTLEVTDNAGGDGGCFSEFEVIVSYAVPGDGTGFATATAACDLEVEVTFEDEVDVTVCEGGTILRTWTATDDCGREVSEVQTLTILPALAPVITSCPGPQTVECPEDIVTTPEAVVATLDCGVTAETTVAGPVIDGPEACPGTTYTYTYTVTDECGRIDQCEQVFTIGENDAPTIDVVPTITVDCFESINPDPNLADVTTACGNGVDFSVSVTDPVLGNGLNCPGETYSVVYTITDACGRTADATQTYVIANDGPTMECPDNCEVLTCYDGDYNAIIEAWINTVEATSSCSVDLTVFNNYDGVDGICVGDFTPVTFSATDACGRSVSCESGIYIIDTDAPDIYQAPEDLLIPCTANTEQIFSDWLADYGGAEAVDACGGEVFWSADTGVNALNCANGPQAIVVTFTVTDGCGNSASVVGTFNTKLLPNAVNVAGLIQTEAAEAVASVEVAAYQSEGMTEMDMSDDNGDYNFEELPYEENTEIVPAKNDDYLNGVTTYDLILLQQHILGINTLNSPYKQIAADANRSGSISTLDLVLLRRLILHVDEELADNTSWRFVDADFVFPNPANAFESDFPEVYTLSGIEEELKDFVAVKIGDLNLDAEANSFHQSDDRSALADLEMLAEDQKLKAGQEYEVSLNAENFASINGFQFTLNFDQSAIEILDIESADLANFDSKNYGMSKVEQGAVTISWHSNTAQDLAKQDAVFTVVLRAESATQLSEVLSISSAYTKAEAYQGSELMNVSLNFSDNGGLVTAQSLKLYQNQPNPFKDATMIGFDLPKAGAVDFMIYDLTGKLVYRAQGDYAAGYNQIEVDRSDLPNGGVFYYHINTDEDAASKKMIIID